MIEPAIDVLFIQPGNIDGSNSVYGELNTSLTSVEQPLLPRLSAGYLLPRGYSVKIFDQESEHKDSACIARWVDVHKPRMVVITVSGHQPSASTQSMPAAREVAQAIKLRDPNQIIIMMGNHPSALPQRTLKEEPIDYVIDGEGPVTLDGLLKLMTGKEDAAPLHEIPGLVWWGYDRKTVSCNPLASLLDLDKNLHGRAWHLLPDPSRYRAHTWQCLDDLSRRTPYAAIYTTLGCSFKCSFCMINVFQHSNTYRRRSPHLVVDEIQMLYREHGVRTFKIYDELFVLNRNHYRAICQGLVDSGIGSDINIWAYSRTDTVTVEDLPLLRAAGIKWLALGIEAGNDAVRAGANKSLRGQADNAMIIDTVRAIQAADINVIGNFIVGLEDDTLETMEETYQLAAKLNTEFMNVYSCMIYPGSALYDQVIKDGKVLSIDWRQYSQHNKFCLPMGTKTVSPRDVLKIRDKFFERYFSRPEYIALVYNKFGAEAVAHIQTMLRYKLKRELLDI